MKAELPKQFTLERQFPREKTYKQTNMKRVAESYNVVSYWKQTVCSPNTRMQRN